MLRVGFSLLAAGMLGCTNGGGGELASSDIRIDGAGDSDQVESKGLQMCAGEEGQIYVVWYDDRNENDDIWLNYSLDGGRTWSPSPLKINHAEANATSPAVGCDGNRVFVAWEDDRDGELENHNIYFNYSVNAGQSWQSEDQLLENDSEGRSMSLGPQVAVWNNRVYVAWFDSLNGAYDIYVASSQNDGASFQQPVRVDSDQAGSAYSAYPQLLTSETGTVYVAWEDSRDELSDIYFAYSQDYGASFSGDIRLDGGDAAGAADSYSPQLATDGEQVFAVWHDGRHGENRDIYMNWSDNSGGTWLGSALRVETDGEGFSDSLYPKVVAFQGSAYFTWQDARIGTGYDIYTRSFREGEFTDEVDQRLDLGDAAGYSNALRPQIAMGENGLVVAWEDRRFDTRGEGYNDIFYNYSLDQGLTYAADDLRVDSVEKGSKFANELAIAVQRQRLLAVWRDGRRGNADIFFHGMKVGKEAEFLVVEQ
jgi:hypothetical protein